jgi:hypothetical protein
MTTKLAEETFDAQAAAQQADAEQSRLADYLIDSAAWEAIAEARAAKDIKDAEDAVWAHTTRVVNKKTISLIRRLARIQKSVRY